MKLIYKIGIAVGILGLIAFVVYVVLTHQVASIYDRCGYLINDAGAYVECLYYE